MHDFEETAALVETKDFAVSELPRPVAEDNGISNTISDTIDAIRRDLADRSNETLPDNGDVIADTINGNNNGNTPEDTILDDDGGEACEGTEILRCLSGDLELTGLAGENNTALIIFLAATSRLFPSPLSVAVKGPSSGGKTYTVQSALRFLPPEACFTLTGASERALIYTDEDLQHRMLVLYEADAIAKGGQGAYLLRTLLSEGEIRHETVKGFATLKITKSGPTGLIVTTTATGLDRELETRLLGLTITDTPEQTRAVFKTLCWNHDPDVDYERWHRLQRWLSTGQRNVVIPFAEQLAERVLALAVRQRRDFGALLTLIRAHALLHRASRDRNDGGAIVASITDYATVRELVAALFSEGIEATVSTTVRQTVDAVAALKKKGEVSLGQLATKLGLDKSVVSRRLRQATELGYLVNRETRRGRPARLVLGDPMPEEVQVLPDPSESSA
jgi:DNA-binding transcriptional ArsR family regulator